MDSRLHVAMSEFLLKTMKERGLTQTQVAAMTGYSVSTINALVRNRRMMSTRTWSDVLDAMGIEVGFRVKQE